MMIGDVAFAIVSDHHSLAGICALVSIFIMHLIAGERQCH